MWKRLRLIAGLQLFFLFCSIPVDTAAAAGRELRIMPLGDSITQGYAASYREPLWHALQDAGWEVDFVGSMDRYYGGGMRPQQYDPDHEGHWGWFADEVLARIADWAARAEPDIALVHLGTNDIGSGQGPQDTVKEVERIVGLLRQQNPNIHVLLAAIIPIGHAGANIRVKTYNAALGALAGSLDDARSRILLVDQFSGFDASQDTYDGLHPNESGIQKMAIRWLSALQQLRSDQPDYRTSD